MNVKSSYLQRAHCDVYVNHILNSIKSSQIKISPIPFRQTLKVSLTRYNSYWMSSETKNHDVGAPYKLGNRSKAEGHHTG